MNVDFQEQDIIIEFTPEGQDGRSVRPKGEWSATAQYVELDLVGYHGNSYIALSTVPVGTLPTDTEYWMTNASNETPYWGNIEGTLSEQTDLQNALDAKADADEVYTKTETDDLLALKADADDVYTKAEADDLLDLKADKADSYTKDELDGIFDGIDNALDTKADTDSVYTKAETNSLLSDKADADDVYTKSQVYTKSETDDLLSTKANTADLGTLAGMNSIDYTSNYLTNKPTLGSLADQDTVDYATEVTNKPTLGDLAALNSIDYTSNYLTNKPTLGSLADQDTVDYETEVTNKPALGTMSAESASDYYDKDEVNDLINNSGVVAELDASGSIATFETNLAENLSRLSVSIDPVQDLHGYDAPWPAGGGKNLLENKAITQIISDVKFTVNSDGSVTIVGTASSQIIFVINNSFSLTNGQSYYVSGISGGANDTYFMYVSGGVNSAVYCYSGDNSITATGQTITVAIYVRSGKSVNTTIYPMIRLSSVSDATFAPYSNVCPISGHTEANIYHEAEYDADADPTVTISLGSTVYGAQLDVVNGVLTVDKATVDLSARTWGLNAQYANLWISTTGISDAKAGRTKMLTECAPYADPTLNSTILGAITNGTSNMWVRNGSETISPSGIAVYELATPITVQLTPAQVQALVGKNYVWSDTGDVALSYFNNNTAEAITDVKQMIASTETSMTATRNYTSGSLIIVGSAMYKALSNIASGSTLVIGSNVQRTTLEEWILALLA